MRHAINDLPAGDEDVPRSIDEYVRRGGRFVPWSDPTPWVHPLTEHEVLEMRGILAGYWRT